MIFGKIEYLNLLPFHVFMKRFTKDSASKMGMHYKQGVPAYVNQKFISRRVDAAFISSIKARKYKNVALGIVAKKEVLSVLVVPNTHTKDDKESATSNMLAKVLHVEGEVLIGDKALRYYLHNTNHIDLAKLWHERYGLPFVFALLCYHKDEAIYKKITHQFLKQKVKIPHYILQEASRRTAIAPKDILHYLNYISYQIDAKSRLSLKKFYKAVDNLG
ncbi:MAG: MqnA/MqnD/SBP family protein [Sulfurimonadaceae bacterium]|jgi:chorismate dehydratase|nr:MqnA/MqnD/SBP family protein [Sulfurimonadaceae bacterium]